MANLGRRLVGLLKANWLLLLILGAIAVAFLVLRTPASAVESVAQVDAMLQDGQPTFIEFYSNT
jgi:hypothetical protein